MKKTSITVVLGLIFNQKNEVLLTLRNEPELPAAHQKWQIPGGGVNFGESPLKALRREIKEELNLTIKLTKTPPVKKEHIWDYEDRQEHVTLTCYLATVKSGKMRVDNQEASDYRWVKITEIDNLETLPLTPDFIKAQAKYIHEINKSG